MVRNVTKKDLDKLSDSELETEFKRLEEAQEKARQIWKRAKGGKDLTKEEIFEKKLKELETEFKRLTEAHQEIENNMNEVEEKFNTNKEKAPEIVLMNLFVYAYEIYYAAKNNKKYIETMYNNLHLVRDNPKFQQNQLIKQFKELTVAVVQALRNAREIDTKAWTLVNYTIGQFLIDTLGVPKNELEEKKKEKENELNNELEEKEKEREELKEKEARRKMEQEKLDKLEEFENELKEKEKEREEKENAEYEKQKEKEIADFLKKEMEEEMEQEELRKQKEIEEKQEKQKEIEEKQKKQDELEAEANNLIKTAQDLYLKADKAAEKANYELYKTDEINTRAAAHNGKIQLDLAKKQYTEQRQKLKNAFDLAQSSAREAAASAREVLSFFDVYITFDNDVLKEALLKKANKLKDDFSKVREIVSKVEYAVNNKHRLKGGYAKYIQFSLSRDLLRIIQNIIILSIFKFARYTYYKKNIVNYGNELVYLLDYVMTLIVCIIFYLMGFEKISIGIYIDQLLSMVLYDKINDDKVLLLPYYLPFVLI